MAVNFSKEVEYVAKLARLTLEPEEKERLAGQLDNIFNIARRIQELDTSGIEPTSHVINLPALLREDITGPSLPAERVLQNAPNRQGNYFRVPSITAAEDRDKESG